MTLLAATTRSAWRLALEFDALPSGATAPGSYALARADGVGTTIAVRVAWATGATSIELALTEPLLDGATYTVAIAGLSADVSFRAPLPAVSAAVEMFDPETAAFGRDLDWLARALDASGDCPEVRGRACLLHDLVAVAFTFPGELVHQHESGAALGATVNGPNLPAQLAQSQAAVQAAWSRDPRVTQCTASLAATAGGDVILRGTVHTTALPDALTLTAS